MFKILSAVAKFFTIEPARKMLALVFAFGLWLFVAIDGTYNYEREILVEYVNLPEKYMIVDSVVRLRTTFSGKGKALFGIWTARPSVVCNLAEVVPGKNVISTRDLVLPVKEVTATFGPRYINIEVDERMTKTVRPLIPLRGVLKNGMSIVAIEVLDTLVATGPKSMMQKLTEFTTESLDVRNNSVTFEKKLKMESVAPLIKFSSENIRVRVIVDSTGSRVFNEISVVVVKNPGQRIKSAPLYIDTLVIAGARSRISALGRQEIIARIRTTDLVPGEYYLSPEIVLPEFLTTVSFKPQRFRVFVY